MLEDNIIQKPLQELSLSDSFKKMAYRNDFNTLQDIVNWPVNVLLQHEGFTYHHYQELRSLLKENNKMDLLKTTNL